MTTFSPFFAPFLAVSPVIDYDHPEVAAQAAALTAGLGSDTAKAEALFLFVRDAITHSADARQNPVTCAASEVLAHGTGFCYAKCHLLVALLRAVGIPAGFGYQRLRVDPETDGGRFCLHGLAAVCLPAYGWYRLDPRGNKPGVDAQFTPPVERLAFAVRYPGEADLPGILDAPRPEILAALARHTTWDSLLADLPDLP